MDLFSPDSDSNSDLDDDMKNSDSDLDFDDDDDDKEDLMIMMLCLFFLMVMEADEELEDLFLLMMFDEYEQLHPSEREAWRAKNGDPSRLWTESLKSSIEMSKLKLAMMNIMYEAARRKIGAKNSKLDASVASSHDSNLRLETKNPKLKASISLSHEPLNSKVEAKNSKLKATILSSYESSNSRIKRRKLEYSASKEGQCALPLLEECVESLNALEDIDGTSYVKAAKLLHADELWRRIFMRMPTNRKRDWVLNI